MGNPSLFGTSQHNIPFLCDTGAEQMNFGYRPIRRDESISPAYTGLNWEIQIRNNLQEDLYVFSCDGDLIDVVEPSTRYELKPEESTKLLHGVDVFFRKFKGNRVKITNSTDQALYQCLVGRAALLLEPVYIPQLKLYLSVGARINQVPKIAAEYNRIITYGKDQNNERVCPFVVFGNIPTKYDITHFYLSFDDNKNFHRIPFVQLDLFTPNKFVMMRYVINDNGEEVANEHHADIEELLADEDGVCIIDGSQRIFLASSVDTLRAYMDRISIDSSYDPETLLQQDAYQRVPIRYVAQVENSLKLKHAAELDRVNNELLQCRDSLRRSEREHTQVKSQLDAMRSARVQEQRMRDSEAQRQRDEDDRVIQRTKIKAEATKSKLAIITASLAVLAAVREPLIAACRWGAKFIPVALNVFRPA